MMDIANLGWAVAGFAVAFGLAKWVRHKRHQRRAAAATPAHAPQPSRQVRRAQARQRQRQR